MKSGEGKIYLAVIKEQLFIQRTKVPEMFRRNEIQSINFRQGFLCNSRRVHSEPRPENKKPHVSPFEAVCAHPAGQVTSVHLHKAEAWCWSVCARLSWKAVLPHGISKAAQEESSEARHITQPLDDFVPLHQAESPSICVRQNAQGKGRAESSILKQDKGRASQVTPARVTSPRSAGRFKGFRTLERGRMRGSHPTL